MPGVVRTSAVLSMVAAVLLTGCGAGSDGHPAAKPKGKATAMASASAPATPTVPAFVPARVGQCWSTTLAQGEAPSWDGSAPVVCTKTHNTVTYAVAKLPEDPSFGRPGKHAIPPAISKNTCSFTRAQKYVGHSLSSPVRIRTLLYLPTPAQYTAGARQVRCDVAVKVGKVYRTLPSRLTAATLAGRAYQICSMGTTKSGPKGKGDVGYGPCTSASTYRLLKYVQLKTKPNQPFPGAKVAFARTLKVCPMLHNGDWVAHPVKAKAWARGDTIGGCWKRLG